MENLTNNTLLNKVYAKNTNPNWVKGDLQKIQAEMKAAQLELLRRKKNTRI